MGALAEDHWFAGFADGEACFGLYQSGGNSALCWVPRLSIYLRADDAVILERLHAEFGGHYQPCARYSRADEANRCPQAGWQVVAKADLLGLVRYFDRFPLRAKKARDYAIWRQAVVIYAAEGGRDPQLPVLAAALSEGRTFEADGPIELPASPQLRLVG